MNEKWKNEKELTRHSARRQEEQGNNPVRDYRLVEKGIIPHRPACRRYATGRLQRGCIPTECPQQGGTQFLPSCIPYGNGREK